MKRTALLVLSAAATLCAAQSENRVVKPEIRVGDSWTYRSTNIGARGTHEHEMRVSFVDDKVILVASTRKSDGVELDSSWTSQWNALTHGGFMFRPHSGFLRFPMRVGDNHEVKNELLRPRENTIENSTTGSVTVVGWETVEVPAGKFRAIKIELDSMVQPSSGARAYRRQVTLWYVPEVRRWVKNQIFTAPNSSGSEELLAYKLNED